MKQFRGIAKSPVAPPTDVVWLYRGVLKYFDNGEWIEIKTSNGGGGDASYSIFKVSNTPEDKAHNLELSQNIGFDEVVAVKVEGSINDTQYNTIGIYHNGYITALQNSTQILFNVDFNSGEITVLESNDISTYLPYVNLEVGNTDEIKQHNLERLTDGFFFVKLNYGYGVGNFHPSLENGVAGKANVTTANGDEVFYDINNDGSIVLDKDYIKPNEPYSVLLTGNQIGVALDDITGDKISKAGELIVTGSTGPITYTRTSDSTSSAVYFTDDNKDGSTTILTYNVSTKTITSSKRIPDSITVNVRTKYPIEDEKVTLLNGGYVETLDASRIIINKYDSNYQYIVLKVFEGTRININILAGSQYGWALYDLSQKQYKHSTNNGNINEIITVEQDGYIAINNSYNPSYSIIVESGKFESADIMWLQFQEILNKVNSMPTDAKKPLEGKKIAFLGDSAIDVPGKFWTVKCAEILGAEQKTFAVGGSTWAAQLTSDGSYGNCMAKRVEQLKASGFNPDIIVTQMGGNDLYQTLGTKEAVMKPNYKLYAKDTTTYGGIRYNIENIIREFPNAILIIGTVFQRMGDKTTTVTDALKDMAYEFACPVIDGNSFSGISNRMETILPNYTDSPTGSVTPEYPRYNWVEPDGEIVPVDKKTENAVKRYGLYTYDGTHKTAKGEERMVNFFAAQILNYVKY